MRERSPSVASSSRSSRSSTGPLVLAAHGHADPARTSPPPPSSTPASPRSAPAWVGAGGSWAWSHLPHEVLLQIMRTLQQLGVPLLPCLTVCRAWSEAAVGLLWLRPVFRHASGFYRMTHILSQALAGLTTHPYPALVRRLNFVSLGPTLDGASFERIAACTRLERLVLAGCTSLTDARVATVLAACPNLISVDLTDVDELGPLTVRALSKAHRLQGLVLSGCPRITGRMLARIARGCPLLKRVKLERAEWVTDVGVVSLARNCPQLVELDLAEVKYLTDAAVRELWLYAENLRELRLAQCKNLTSSAFPDASTLDMPAHMSKVLNPPPAEAPDWEDPDEAEASPSPPLLDAGLGVGVDFASSLRLGRGRTAKPLLMGPQLRMVDLTGCEQVTDAAVQGLVALAPRLRNVTLSKCVRLTDAALEALGKLGRALHLLHLGRLEQLTDAAVVHLAHKCTRLRYLDLAYCARLTDRAVAAVATNLPKLKRIGLVKVPNLTAEGVYTLSARFHTLERVHLSYCDQLSIPPIFDLLVSLPHLTHLSLTGIPAFRRTDLQQFCRPPPKDLTSGQRAIFCVYSGRGIPALREYMKLHLFPPGTDAILRSVPVEQKGVFLEEAMLNISIPFVPAFLQVPVPAWGRAPPPARGPLRARLPGGLHEEHEWVPPEDEDDAHVRAVEAAQRQQDIYNPEERPWSAARSGETMAAPARDWAARAAGSAGLPANPEAEEATSEPDDRPHHAPGRAAQAELEPGPELAQALEPEAEYEPMQLDSDPVSGLQPARPVDRAPHRPHLAARPWDTTPGPSRAPDALSGARSPPEEAGPFAFRTDGPSSDAAPAHPGPKRSTATHPSGEGSGLPRKSPRRDQMYLGDGAGPSTVAGLGEVEDDDADEDEDEGEGDRDEL